MTDGFLKGSLVKEDFWRLGIILLGCVLLQALCIHLSDRLQSAAGFMLMADIRIKLGEHLRRLPMGYFTSGNIGKISSVLSTDMVFIEENSMMTLADTMSYFFSAVIFTLLMFFFNPYIGSFVLAGCILLTVVGERKYKNGINLSYERQQQSENLTSAVLDYVEGIGIIKTYNMLGEKSDEMKKNFDRSCEESLKFEYAQVPWGVIINVIFEICAVVLGLVCTLLFLKGSLSTTYLIGVLLFLLDIFVPLKIVYMESEKLTIMDKCLDRIEDIMNEKELTDDKDKQVPWAKENIPAVEFKNVRFSYDKSEIIKGISFKVFEGETVALVGPSGSGKTTLANLIARFWDVDGGEIFVNGEDVREVSLASLLSNISMVFQNVYLFKDTVYNNILMGNPDAGKDQVVDAAKKAGCYDFIMSLPDGFDTMVGEGGASLSGGEKQRISIARCILKDAPIVILDEATASVDADNEALIQKAITELCRGKTLIVIAHRLKTIKDSDCIFVLNNGKIAERGTHEELMSSDGIYKNFVRIKNSDTTWYKKEIS
ncbi:MAG: ABC transporter ATP-binding protein/permease, partial [Eubacterium sp.]|nr:ABC transporter ATP-binding protein/permease [Eubacterium sp.]